MFAGPAVHLFGAVSVEVDGCKVSAGGQRQAGVLAVLALRVGRPVSVDRLIDGIWGEDPPTSVTNVLQVYVSSLRKLLRPAGLGITRAGSTYTLAACLDDVDIEVFHRLAAEGRAALRAVDPERALASLERARELWDPTPFAGLDGCAFVDAARAALLPAGLGLATDLGAALCGLGRSDDAVAEAERLVESHPFYEPAWELLMRALYYSGRQRDALVAFSRARSSFVEELGLDPPATLVELERQILDRSLPPVADRHQSLRSSPDPSAVSVPRLPEPPSGMIGRLAEVEQILRLEGERARLITLVGLGGIGKTTTALVAGHRLIASGHDVVFCELAAVVESEAAMDRLCQAAEIGVGPDAAASLAEADPDVILIADNGEQVSGFPGAIARLLANTSRLRLIVTSRVAMRIRAEHLIPIHALETSSASGASDASRLFVERVRRLRNDLNLTGEEDAIIEICELAGGIPLAIEVAAGRLGHLTPLALLDRLRRQRAALLDGRGAADLPDRQSSLRTVLDATSTLLTTGAAVLARRLCALKGPISLALMEQMFAEEIDLVDYLTELVDASLMNGPDQVGRYLMPIPVTEYFADGHESLADGRSRFLVAVLSRAETLMSTVDKHGRWAEGELLDDAAAVTVACDEAVTRREAHAGARLVVALRRYWLLGGRLGEALQFCGAVLELGPDDRDRAHVQLVYGQFAGMVNRSDAAELLSEGIQLAEVAEGVDAHLLVNSWCYLGSWMCAHGEMDEARHAAEHVEKLAHASGIPSVVELGRDFGAHVAAQVGDVEMAARLSEQSLADARRSGDRYVIVDLLQRLGENLLVLGRHDEADRLMDEAMELARTIPIGPLAATVIATRAAVDIELGRLSAAIGAGLEALRLTATLYPDPVVQASVLRILGAAWCSAGDLVLSARCDGAAAAVLQRAGAPIDRASLRPIDRRLEASRNDPGAASAARIAAMDPDAVIDELLGRSAASSLRS